MKMSFFILLLFLLNSSYVVPQSNDSIPSLAKAVAQNYGIDLWWHIKSIDFTFNVKTQKINVKRSWKWETGTGIVQYSGTGKNGKDTVISYSRKSLNSADPFITSVDAKFINDSYWLLFPFHLVWDKNVVITDQGTREFPISHETGKSLKVQYTGNVGYTPNDVFILYLDENNMIKEWIYRPGGDKAKERIYTWQDNKNFDGITISTVHNGAHNNMKVWFTDIKVSTDNNSK